MCLPIHLLSTCAYLLNDQDLLKKAARFIIKNKGKFKDDNQEWKEFQKQHSLCFVQLMNIIMFEDTKENSTNRPPAAPASRKRPAAASAEEGEASTSTRVRPMMRLQRGTRVRINPDSQQLFNAWIMNMF